MNTSTPEDALVVATEKRILNEFASKILNEEKMTQVQAVRHSGNRLSHLSEMQFHCECDDRGCIDMILLSTEEYEKVHHKTKQFIVVNSHVRFDIEEVMERFSNYSLVEKFFPHTREEST